VRTSILDRVPISDVFEETPVSHADAAVLPSGAMHLGKIAQLPGGADIAGGAVN
jgi:hypothetical protein